jgi:hypothetical protein
MYRATLSCAAFALLAACATGPQPEAKLTPKQEKELTGLLDGKVAGEPVSCVPNLRAGDNLRAISDDVLVLKVNRNLVYRNNLNGRCSGLSRGDILVLEVRGSQYCRGDIARVVSPMAGMMTGSCSLGDFVPYRTAGK